MARIVFKLFFVFLFLFGCATQKRIPELTQTRKAEPLHIAECKAIQKLLYKINTADQREKYISKDRALWKNVLRVGFDIISLGGISNSIEAEYQTRLKIQDRSLAHYNSIPESTKARCSELGF